MTNNTDVATAEIFANFWCDVCSIHKLIGKFPPTYEYTTSTKEHVVEALKRRDAALIARAIAPYVEALKFYATAWDFEHQANGKTFYATPATHLLEDCGKIARQALNADRQEGK